jgi:hypothetical protein
MVRKGSAVRVRAAASRFDPTIHWKKDLTPEEIMERGREAMASLG